MREVSRNKHGMQRPRTPRQIRRQQIHKHSFTYTSHHPSPSFNASSSSISSPFPFNTSESFPVYGKYVLISPTYRYHHETQRDETSVFLFFSQKTDHGMMSSMMSNELQHNDLKTENNMAGKKIRSGCDKTISLVNVSVMWCDDFVVF